MRLENLVTFLAVVDEGTYAKAAEKLGISEGAISHQISTLEKFFGARLINRTVKGSTLTPEGEIVLEAARRIVREMERAEREIDLLKSKPRGLIAIEASTIPGEHILPKLIKKFKSSYEGVDFIVHVSDSKKATDKLISGKVDIAAVGTLQFLPDVGKIEKIEIGEEKMVLIVPPKHELAAEKTVDLEAVLRYPFITREPGSGTRAEVERILVKSGISPSKLSVYEFGSTESVIAAVSEGLGISIISEIAARKAEKSGFVKVVELSGIDNTRVLYLLRRRGEKLSKAHELFWNFCKGEAAF